MELDLERAVWTKERGSILVNLDADTAAKVNALSKSRCRTAVVILAIQSLHAIISGDCNEIDEIGERLEMALPGTVDATQLRANLDGLACAVERAKLRRLEAEKEYEKLLFAQVRHGLTLEQQESNRDLDFFAGLRREAAGEEERKLEV